MAWSPAAVTLLLSPATETYTRTDRPHFPQIQSELFKTILADENLRFDRDGRPRTAYRLRHTNISMRLMEGANIYQIAKNCRTSAGMIEKHYGVHIKNSLNTAAINVVRSNEDWQEEEV
jgi:hypothetical protein